MKKKKNVIEEVMKEGVELLGEYFWVVGLGLFIVALDKLFSDAISLFVVGVFTFLLGVWLKTIIKK